MHFGTPGDEFDREFEAMMKFVLKFIKWVSIGCAVFVLSWLFLVGFIMALIVIKSCV